MLLHVELTLIAMHEHHKVKQPRVDIITKLLLQSGNNVRKADSIKISHGKTNTVTVKSVAEILCSEVKKDQVRGE